MSTRVVTEAIPDLADDEKLFGGIGIRLVQSLYTRNDMVPVSH